MTFINVVSTFSFGHPDKLWTVPGTGIAGIDMASTGIHLPQWEGHSILHRRWQHMDRFGH